MPITEGEMPDLGHMNTEERCQRYILGYLNLHGQTRAGTLEKNVTKEVEYPISIKSYHKYLKMMIDAGKIVRIEHSRADVEYAAATWLEMEEVQMEKMSEILEDIQIRLEIIGTVHNLTRERSLKKSGKISESADPLAIGIAEVLRGINWFDNYHRILEKYENFKSSPMTKKVREREIPRLYKKFDQLLKQYSTGNFFLSDIASLMLPERLPNLWKIDEVLENVISEELDRRRISDKDVAQLSKTSLNSWEYLEQLHEMLGSDRSSRPKKRDSHSRLKKRDSRSIRIRQ